MAQSIFLPSTAKVEPIPREDAFDVRADLITRYMSALNPALINHGISPVPVTFEYEAFHDEVEARLSALEEEGVDISSWKFDLMCVGGGDIMCTELADEWGSIDGSGADDGGRDKDKDKSGDHGHNGNYSGASTIAGASRTFSFDNQTTDEDIHRWLSTNSAVQDGQSVVASPPPVNVSAPPPASFGLPTNSSRSSLFGIPMSSSQIGLPASFGSPTNSLQPRFPASLGFPTNPPLPNNPEVPTQIFLPPGSGYMITAMPTVISSTRRSTSDPMFTGQSAALQTVEAANNQVQQFSPPAQGSVQPPFLLNNVGNIQVINFYGPPGPDLFRGQ